MAVKFRGTIVIFGSQVAKLRSARYSKTGTQIDVTNSQSSEQEFETGFATSEVTFTLYGTPAIDVDDVANTSIQWTTGNTKSLGNCICTAINQGGDVDGAITTDVTLRKASA